MTDHELLKHIGLSKDELTDLQHKVHNFLNSGQLNAAQKSAFKRSLKTPEHGAAELGGDVTPQRLTSFLQEHAPADALLLGICEEGH